MSGFMTCLYKLAASLTDTVLETSILAASDELLRVTGTNVGANCAGLTATTANTLSGERTTTSLPHRLTSPGPVTFRDRGNAHLLPDPMTFVVALGANSIRARQGPRTAALSLRIWRGLDILAGSSHLGNNRLLFALGVYTTSCMRHLVPETDGQTFIFKSSSTGTTDWGMSDRTITILTFCIFSEGYRHKN